jgi:flagellin
MSVIINTNVDSLKIQNILSASTSKLSSAMQRMSSGLKINSAKDDAAGTVISARMNVQLDGNNICQNNIQTGNALLSTAEGNIDVVLDNVTRIRDLTLQAKNGTFSNAEIESMQKEVSERIDEINRVSESSKFSQLELFGNADMKTNGIKFQVGQNADIAEEGQDLVENNIITAKGDIFDSVRFSALTGVEGTFDLSQIKAGSSEGYADFNAALSKLDTAIDNLTNRKSLIGSTQNRLESALETLTTQYSNLSSAKSIITDTDVAGEASIYTQNQILQQVSTSLLAQANQAPGIALSLI